MSTNITQAPPKVYKLPLPLPNTLLDRQYYSPTFPLEKVIQVKSPLAKGASGTFATENFDLVEESNVDSRIHPQTTKTLKNSYLSLSPDKTKQISAAYDKTGSIKTRDSQAKVASPSYESMLSKKIQQAKGNNKLDTTKETGKTKMMEEPPKKSSMPSNLTLTLNNTYTNAGSNSHRAPLNSPTVEQQRMNGKLPSYIQFNRKNSQKVETEIDQQQANPIVSNKHSQAQHQPLSAFLSDLTSLSPKHMQGVARINIGNINTISNNNTNQVEKVPSPKDSNNQSQSNDLVKLLNNKNKEIHKLKNDKSELKSTLESLNGEINSLKMMKSLLSEKEKVIENLQNSLFEAVRESDDLKREFQNENIIPQDKNFTGVQGQNTGKKPNNSASISDMESIKILISQLKSLNEGTDEPSPTVLADFRNTVMDTAGRKSQQPKQKKAENAHESFNNDKRGDRSSDPHSSQPDLYQRNFSSTLEDLIARKMESPYYEAMKNNTKKNGKSSADSKKDSADSRKVANDNQSSKPSGSSTLKKGDSLLGTPRKVQLSVDKLERQFKIQPNTTTAGETDILARKFSHDPKLNSKGSGGLLGKKQSIVEPGSTLAYTAEKESSGEPLDIGKALGELKNRIGRLLNKHKDDHSKLKVTHEMYLQKLQELLKN